MNVFDSGLVSGPGHVVKKNVCFWPSEWACSECIITHSKVASVYPGALTIRSKTVNHSW